MAQGQRNARNEAAARAWEAAALACLTRSRPRKPPVDGRKPKNRMKPLFSRSGAFCAILAACTLAGCGPIDPLEKAVSQALETMAEAGDADVDAIESLADAYEAAAVLAAESQGVRKAWDTEAYEAEIKAWEAEEAEVLEAEREAEVARFGGWGDSAALTAALARESLRPDPREAASELREAAAAVREVASELREAGSEFRERVSRARKNSSELRAAASERWERASKAREWAAEKREAAAERRGDVSGIREAAAEAYERAANAQERAEARAWNTVAEAGESAAEAGESAAEAWERPANAYESAAEAWEAVADAL